MTDAEFRRSMSSILGELETLYSADQIGAVQINIALRNGDVRSLCCHDDGFKILIIAAAAIGQHEALRNGGIQRELEAE